LPNQFLAELYPVLRRHSQQVGYGQHGKGLGIDAHELAFTLVDESVDLLFRQTPHIVLVLF